MKNERHTPPIADRAIVLQLLRDDHPQRWSRAELECKLSSVAPLDISDALARLDAEGVVVVDGEWVQASGCARCLDALEVICV